jgi:glycine cleavage system transcriptional repressor
MLIITAVGPDKPGMVHALAQILFESGCNIEDTTMTRLSGQFSMILAVESPQNISVAELEARLVEPLKASHELTIDVVDIEEREEPESDAPRFLLTAYGPEKTGLLANLTGVLSQRKVNVTDVQTRVASHGTVYVMLLELELPADVVAADLEQEIRAQNEGLKISLREMDEETL